MSTTTTIDNKRRPLNIDINGYGTVSSTEQYTLDEAADIQRMLVEVADMVGEGREEFRIRPRGIKVVKDVSR